MKYMLGMKYSLNINLAYNIDLSIKITRQTLVLIQFKVSNISSNLQKSFLPTSMKINDVYRVKIVQFIIMHILILL